jgi:hypothetical protein
MHDAETAAAETEHGVELVEFLDALFDLGDGHAHFLGEIVLRGILVGEELVQRRVEEANGGREALERLEDADEVALLLGRRLARADEAANAVATSRNASANPANTITLAKSTRAFRMNALASLLNA